MAQRTIEIIVGLFMVAGLAALLVLALQVSGLSPKAAESTYTLYANFNVFVVLDEQDTEHRVSHVPC